MLSVIASDMVNLMSILYLIECVASDYAESLTAESGDRQIGIR